MTDLNNLLRNPWSLPLIWLQLHLQCSLLACLRSPPHTRKRSKLRRGPERHLEVQRGVAGTVSAPNPLPRPRSRTHPHPPAATPQVKVKSDTSTLAQDAQRPQGVAKTKDPHNRSIPTTSGSKEARRGSKRESRSKPITTTTSTKSPSL